MKLHLKPAQQNNDKTVEELSQKRNSAIKTALLWSVPGMIASTIAVTAHTMSEWREAKSFWDFIKPKNPGRIFKHPVTAIAYVAGLGSLITSLVYAVKGNAYNDAVQQIKNDHPQNADQSRIVIRLQNTDEKKWASEDLLKKDTVQIRAK